MCSSTFLQNTSSSSFSRRARHRVPWRVIFYHHRAALPAARVLAAPEPNNFSLHSRVPWGGWQLALFRRRRRGSVTTRKPHQYWCVHDYEGTLKQFNNTFHAHAENNINALKLLSLYTNTNSPHDLGRRPPAPLRHATLKLRLLPAPRRHATFRLSLLLQTETPASVPTLTCKARTQSPASVSDADTCKGHARRATLGLSLLPASKRRHAAFKRWYAPPLDLLNCTQNKEAHKQNEGKPSFRRRHKMFKSVSSQRPALHIEIKNSGIRTPPPSFLALRTQGARRIPRIPRFLAQKVHRQMAA